MACLSTAIVFASGTGCGASSDGTDDDATDQLDIGATKDDGVERPLGTYRVSENNLGRHASFQLLRESANPDTAALVANGAGVSKRAASDAGGGADANVDAIPDYKDGAAVPIRLTTRIGDRTVAALPIIVPSSPSKVELFAAQELGEYLRRATGAEFSTVTESEETPGQGIFVGATTAALAAFSLETAGDEGWFVRANDGRLLLAGGARRGTLYAVYHFLEDVLGVRWYSPWIERVPHCNPCEIQPALNLSGRPYFSMRDLAIALNPLNDADVTGLDPARNQFFLHNRLNGYDIGSRSLWRYSGVTESERVVTGDWERRGGAWLAAGPVNHSFAYFFPNAEFFASHPEYYSLRRTADHPEGVRMEIGDGQHLCLTNPDVAKIMIGKVKSEFARHPEADSVSVSPSDGNSPTLCDCGPCTKAREQHGNSGLLLNFVNRVAEAVAEDYPDKYIVTLAYNVTRMPPLSDVRPRDNVIVWVCSLRSDQVYHPLGNDNLELASTVPGWLAITKNVFFWDYALSDQFPLSYFQPLYWRFAEQLRALPPRSSAYGVFVESETHNIHPSVPYDFFEMRYWLMAKLLEDPNRDVGVLMHDFVTGVYGAAAPFIESYLQLQRERLPRWPYRAVDYDYVRQAQALFDAALTAVSGDPATTARIQDLRVNLDLVTLAFRQQSVTNYLAEGHALADYPFPPSFLRDRIAATLYRSAEPSPLFGTPIQYSFTDVTGTSETIPRTLRDLTMRFARSLTTPTVYAPRPAGIPSAAATEVIEITAPMFLTRGRELVPDPDAALGLAYEVRRAPDVLPAVFVYDPLRGTPINSGEIIATGSGYHIYPIVQRDSRGVVIAEDFTISETTRLCLTSNWQSCLFLYTLHDPGAPDQRWRVFVSLKTTADRFRYDRVFLVRS